ncbi:alpha-galactosidase [Streptomyces sp. NBC_00876]|uniref:alpha-galactosidase n=1 Tax=Streptomyces sp. NBC_00876 TaxID=2975853 RepID=UPI003869F77B|nr:alpha-galactosidase [Streptomyces sp. NBC_00876]
MKESRTASPSRPSRLRALAMGVSATLSVALLPLGVVNAPSAAAQDNGVSPTPPMGWSSWSYTRYDANEDNIKTQAKAMKDLGLIEHGWNRINIDDFWYLKPSETVDEHGRWKTDPARFPNGMKAMGDYVHGLGEKFGIYLTPGMPKAAYDQDTPIEGTSYSARDIVSDTSKFESGFGPNRDGMYYIDYAKNPAAAQAFVDSWAKQLASWGVDYLKLDGVGTWNIPDIEAWSKALDRTDRDIHLGLSLALDIKHADTWRRLSHSWRTNGDLECYCPITSKYPLTSWAKVSERFRTAPKWTQYADPGSWNDFDSLEVGNGADTGLTGDERRSHMTLWAISASNLLLGVDMTKMDDDDLAMLKNDEVIAVNQAGRPARPVDQLTDQQVWTVPNPDGSQTVALFNLGSASAKVTARFPDLGLAGPAAVRDLWSRTDLGTSTDAFSATVPAHGSRLLKVTPSSEATPTTVQYNLVNSAGGRLLDVEGGSRSDGAGLVATGAGSSASQKWQLRPTGDGHYAVRNVKSGKLVNVPGPTSTPGTQLIQYKDDHKSNSQWKLKPAGNGAYTIASRYNGRNIAASGGKVVQQTASTSAAQQWKLVPLVTAGTKYKLVNAVSGGRLDVNQASKADSATIVQWQDNGNPDQQWTFTARSSGQYTLANVNSGKVLNVPGPTDAYGTQLIQYTDDGNSNSRWRVVDAGPNLVRIESVHNGLAVDLDDSSVSNGAKIIQWGANSGGNQKWNLVPAS